MGHNLCGLVKNRETSLEMIYLLLFKDMKRKVETCYSCPDPDLIVAGDGSTI